MIKGFPQGPQSLGFARLVGIWEYEPFGFQVLGLLNLLSIIFRLLPSS